MKDGQNEIRATSGKTTRWHGNSGAYPDNMQVGRRIFFEQVRAKPPVGMVIPEIYPILKNILPISPLSCKRDILKAGREPTGGVADLPPANLSALRLVPPFLP